MYCLLNMNYVGMYVCNLSELIRMPVVAVVVYCIWIMYVYYVQCKSVEVY